MKTLDIKLTRLSPHFAELNLTTQTGAQFSATRIPFRQVINKKGRLELTIEFPRMEGYEWDLFYKMLDWRHNENSTNPI